MQRSMILFGALFLACAAQAQTTDDNNNITNTPDSTHRHAMHRTWNGNRNGRGDDGRGGERRIHYSPEQRKQIRDISTDYHKKAADLFNNDNLTLRQYKAALVTLQKERKSKMQTLLTPEQKDRLAKGKQRAAENRQVMAAAHVERLKIRLGLTDQQVATIRSKEEALHGQLRSIHENDDLLPQQKMEQFKALAGKRKEIIKSVLTPDQLTKFNEMEMAHQGGRERGRMPMERDRTPMTGDGGR